MLGDLQALDRLGPSEVYCQTDPAYNLILLTCIYRLSRVGRMGATGRIWSGTSIVISDGTLLHM
jgi:hypothetical protein